MGEQQITVTLEADASGCLRVIRQVTRSVDTLAGKKVGNAGMPELADGAQKASGKVKQTERDIDSLSSAVSKVKGGDCRSLCRWVYLFIWQSSPVGSGQYGTPA